MERNESRDGDCDAGVMTNWRHAPSRWWGAWRTAALLPFVTRRSRSLFTRPVMWAVIVTRAVMVLETNRYIINHTEFPGYRHSTREYSYNSTRMHAYHGHPVQHARYSQSLLGSRPQHWLRFPLEEPIVIRNHLLIQAQLVILNMLTMRYRFNLQLTM